MNKRIAVVTGGNRGIGFEIARGLARRGLHVFLTSRSGDAASEACSKLALEGTLVPHALDVTQPSSVEALRDEVLKQHGGLDVLVNNAGIALDGFDEAVARSTLDTNYFGPLAMIGAFAPSLRPNGRVVNVSSGVADRDRLSRSLRSRLDATDLTVDDLSAWMHEFVASVAAGDHSDKGWPSSAYCVSKIGLNRLTELMAHRFQQDDRAIACNAACPGWVRTDMGGPEASSSPAEGADTPLWLALLDNGDKTGGFFRDRAPASW